MRPLSVLALDPGLEVGGCERYLAAVCRTLASRGTKLHVATPSTPSLIPLRDELASSATGLLGWAPTETSGVEGYWDLTAQEISMRRHIATVGPQVVFFAVPWLPSICGALRACHDTGTPYFACFQLVDEVIELPLDVISSVTRDIEEGTSVLAAVSHANRARLAVSLRMGTEAIRLIPNGVSYTGPPLVSDPPRTPLVVAVGRLVQEKGYRTYLEACALVRRERDGDFRGAWVGSGKDETDATQLNDALGSPVRFLGQRKDVRAILGEASIYAHCSHMEGLSFALMEAMEAGLAVIASDIPENRQLVNPGRTGLLFRPGDSSQLARQLDRLLSDREERARLGANARSLVRSAYREWDSISRAIAVLRGLARIG